MHITLHYLCDISQLKPRHCWFAPVAPSLYGLIILMKTASYFDPSWLLGGPCNGTGVLVSCESPPFSIEKLRFGHFRSWEFVKISKTWVNSIQFVPQQKATRCHHRKAHYNIATLQLLLHGGALHGFRHIHHIKYITGNVCMCALLSYPRTSNSTSVERVPLFTELRHTGAMVEFHRKWVTPSIDFSYYD